MWTYKHYEKIWAVAKVTRVMCMAKRTQAIWLFFYLLVQVKRTTATIHDYSDKGLTSIPQTVPTEATSLNFKGNLLTSVSDDDFRIFVNLEKLYLTSNRITNISEHAFDQNLKLNGLYLDNNPIGHFIQFLALRPVLWSFSMSNCSITNASWNMDVTDYKQLRMLHLKHNFIRQFPTFDASTKSVLKYFYLMSCGISEIPTNYFQGFDNLLKLHLAGNNIHTLFETALAGLLTLKQLLLGENKLKTIHHLTFSRIPNVQTLSLYANFLGVIPNVSSLAELRILDLKGNNFTGNVYESQFLGLKELTTLDLRFNIIPSFEESSLQHMPKLQQLSLQGNRLTKFKDPYPWCTTSGCNGLTINLETNRIPCDEFLCWAKSSTNITTTMDDCLGKTWAFVTKSDICYDYSVMKIQSREPNTAKFEDAARKDFEMNIIHQTAYFTECAALCYKTADCTSFKYYDKESLLLNECHIWKTFP